MVDNKPIGSGFLLGVEQGGKQFYLSCFSEARLGVSVI
jgi:hypothetical protein